MQTLRLVSKFNLYGFVRQDKNERYMLSCLLWAVELLFRSLSHFLFVVPLGGQKKVLTLGWAGCKNAAQLKEKQLMQASTSAERRAVEKKALEHLTQQQQQLGCKLHSSSHRRAGREGRSGALNAIWSENSAICRKPCRRWLNNHSRPTNTASRPAGRCPCSFPHFLLFRQVVKKCYCWVLAV